MEVSQTYDELKFAENVEKLVPILENMNELMASGRVTLKSQKYRIENNDRTIQDQNKLIAENKTLIDQAKKQATDIIEVAEDKSKEIESNMKMRVVQINQMEKEAKEKFKKAEKLLWEAENKQTAKV